MQLYHWLGFDSKTMSVRTELIAGATTFLTMCYVLAVNPTVLSTTGMDRAALFTSTALASAAATLLLAFLAKLPFAQAPSMGLNAFFAFTLCQALGYTWQQALAISLIEGVAFLLITFIHVREYILYAIPTNLRYAISVGIGMFIAFIGLKNAGIVVNNPNTFVSLGKFTPTAAHGDPWHRSHLGERCAHGAQCQGLFVFWYHPHHTGGHPHGRDRGAAALAAGVHASKPLARLLQVSV